MDLGERVRAGCVLTRVGGVEVTDQMHNRQRGACVFDERAETDDVHVRARDDRYARAEFTAERDDTTRNAF